MHIAVEEKDEAKIKQVCDRELRLLNKYNRPHETPLIIACVRNNEKVARLLLDYYRYDEKKELSLPNYIMIAFLVIFFANFFLEMIIMASLISTK